jgi:hypothetical protein
VHAQPLHPPAFQWPRDNQNEAEQAGVENPAPLAKLAAVIRRLTMGQPTQAELVCDADHDGDEAYRSYLP